MRFGPPQDVDAATRARPRPESLLPGFDPLHRHGVYCDGQDGTRSTCAEEARRGASAVFHVWPEVRLSQHQNGFCVQDDQIRPRASYGFLERDPRHPSLAYQPNYIVVCGFDTREEAQEAQTRSLVKRVQIELGEPCTAPDEPLSLPAQVVFGVAISNKLDLYNDTVLAALIANARGSVRGRGNSDRYNISDHQRSISLSNPWEPAMATDPAAVGVPAAQLNQIKATLKTPEHDENLAQLIQNTVLLNEALPMEIQRLRETVYQGMSASEARDRRTRRLCAITLMVALGSGFATTIASLPTFYGLWRIYTGQAGK